MSRVDFYHLMHDTRARVYLLWAGITGVGYVSTQFYQNKNINFVWFVLSVIGFAYMYKVMPMRVKQMRNIFLSWAIPISLGIGVSIIAVRTDLMPDLVGYMGVFWLVISALGYFWNGVFDDLSAWYYIAAAVNTLAAVICYYYEPILLSQYFFAGIVSVWSMLMLWVFRSDA